MTIGYQESMWSFIVLFILSTYLLIKRIEQVKKLRKRVKELEEEIE